MADFDAAGNTLATHFSTQMASAQPSVKIVWRNGPKLNPAPDPAIDSWVHYSWLPIEDRAAAIGGSLYRGLGLVDIQIFTPLGRGTGTAEGIERSIQTMFRDQAISGLVVGPVIFSQIGESEGWYQTQVRIRIQSDESV